MKTKRILNTVFCNSYPGPGDGKNTGCGCGAEQNNVFFEATAGRPAIVGGCAAPWTSRFRGSDWTPEKLT